MHEELVQVPSSVAPALPFLHLPCWPSPDSAREDSPIREPREAMAMASAMALRPPSLRRRRIAARAAVPEEGGGSKDAGVRLVFPDGERRAEVGVLLRNAMKDNQVEVYTTWGKVWNCSGAGQCGLCMVDVMEGEEFLNEKSDHEKKKLKGKPASWRLSCQTELVQPGTVRIQNLPQAQ